MRTIRSLDATGVETLLSWAGREGWNPGLADALAFRSVDPDGFIGAFVDDQMAAGIAAVAYDHHFGFIGLYICHPDWRGQGHGRAVWDAGMAHLGDRTIGLDGVPQQQANYASMGFKVAYETVRMTGSVPKGHSGAVLEQASAATVTDLELTCFPAKRAAFLEHWFAAPNTARILQGGDARGYGVLRQCLDGHKIGPLFAADLDAAKSLLVLASGISGPVQIDVPARQSEFLNLLMEWGFQPGFNTARMYRGPAPKLALNRVFAVTSLELG